MKSKLSNEYSLTDSFENSLSENVIDAVTNLGEVCLDAMLNDGVLKDIPFLSTIVSLYRIGNGIRSRYNMKKLLEFLKEIQAQTADDEIRQEYIKRFRENKRFRKDELEYLIVIVDRYVGFQKPKMLAKLYISYLDKTITWQELCVYSEVIDRFLLNDFQTLLTGEVSLSDHSGYESVLRLVALGLMAEKRKIDQMIYGGTFDEFFDETTGETMHYTRTAFGEKLVLILNK